MEQFTKNSSIAAFQDLIRVVYGLPDDRLFSLSDLLSNQQKFTMRALKGIRKGDMKKLSGNLLISLSWCMAVANRLHIDVEDIVWRRFPMMCSYCGNIPCVCKITKKNKRVIIKVNSKSKPRNIQEFQYMFERIYPPDGRTLADAGIHLAEEMGELSEAVHNYSGEHTHKQFIEIECEMADYISCLFGVANSARVSVAESLSKMFSNGCHSCHKIPCSCNFSSVANYKS